MKMSEESKVPFTPENIKRCMCPKCPVQADSKCAMDKLDNLVKELEASERTFLTRKAFQEYIVQQGRPPVRILTLTSNVFVTPVRSGMNINSETALRLCTSARMVKLLN